MFIISRAITIERCEGDEADDIDIFPSINEVA